MLKLQELPCPWTLTRALLMDPVACVAAALEGLLPHSHPPPPQTPPLDQGLFKGSTRIMEKIMWAMCYRKSLNKGLFNVYVDRLTKSSPQTCQSEKTSKSFISTFVIYNLQFQCQIIRKEAIV